MVDKMKKGRYNYLVTYFNVFILVFGIILLVLNIEMISVIHASASEWLPVLLYETYSTFETSFLYLLILLAILNILSFNSRYVKPLKVYILYIIPIIAIISIVIFVLNPHTLILRLDRIEIVGIIAMILFSLFTINTILQIYLEGIMKKFLITLGIIIGVLLLSDFIHESGHAIIILLSGGDITAFFPFPVLLGDELNAGCVFFSNVPSSLIPLVMLGGEIFQWITICLLLIFFGVKPKYRRNKFLIALLIIAFLDFPLYIINNSMGLPHWFLIGSTRGDIIVFSDLTNFPLWALILIGCGQLVIMILIFYFLLFRNREKNNKEAFKEN
jgi:hypothetical protein